MPSEPVTDPGFSSVPLAEGLEYSREAWEKATAAVLRKTRRLSDDAPDSDAWSVLTTTTLDGIDVTPLGTPDVTTSEPGLPGQAPFTRGSTATRELDGWDNRAWFADPDAQRTAADVTTDLENGINSLWLSLGTGGTPIGALADVLEPVFLDLAAVVLDAPHEPLEAARAFAAVVEDKGVAPAPGTTVGVDPIGALLRGNGVTDLDIVTEAAAVAERIGCRAVTVDATAAHDAGASDAQELAWSLAVGAAYLRVLVADGRDVAAAADLIDFRYAATDQQFPTIAKLRAARRLWHRVLELSGVDAPAGQLQHAVTSRPMMSRYDPYVNMLRTTVAAFSAGVGGAAAVTVLPFDEPLGLPEAFSRRIARNTCSLLISESHVGTVTDAAGGAHAVEQLTDDLARTAWDLFGRLDAAGPAGDDLVAAVRPMIEQAVSDRALLIAKRRLPLTGVSEFPNLHEQTPERRPYGDGRPQVLRHGREFEAMRDEPATSPVFLATMGTVAQHTARATFATNLFAAGGIDVNVAGATEDTDGVLAAYDGQPVVCLCGNDAGYEQWGADLVAALREAGARHVVLAGKAEVGADATAAADLDALAFLRAVREELSA
jgi:methylmalonyl-CoA mutase